MTVLRGLLRAAAPALVVASVVGAAAGGATALLLRQVSATISGEQGSDGRAALRFFWLIAAGMFAEVLAHSIIVRTTGGLLLKLRLEIARQVLGARLHQFEAAGSSRAMAIFLQDILAVATGMRNVPDAIVNASIILATLIHLTLSHGRMMIVLLAVGLIGLAIVWSLRSAAHRHEKQLRAEGQRLIKDFQGLVEGVKELKLHDAKRRHFMSEGLTATAGRVRSRSIRVYLLDITSNAAARALILGVIGVLLFFAPSLASGSTAHGADFAVAICYLVSPVGFMMNFLGVLSRARIAMGEVESYHRELIGANEPALIPTEPLPSAWETISLRGVVRNYGNGSTDFTLGPISLDIERGEVVFLVGGNGSGKSSLVGILCGLYEPDRGTISLGSVPITADLREAYRGLFSAVFFDFHTFPDLRYVAPPDQIREQATKLLARFGLAEKVRFEGGAMVHAGLSAGQRRRLALVCALLEDRPVLVFDEFGSDQDPNYKRDFYMVLLPELKAAGKTVVVVSHDDRYFEVADRLVKLEDGSIAEESTSVFMARLHGGQPPTRR